MKINLSKGGRKIAPIKKERKGEIAIIGGETSGLIAASELRKEGFNVTIYEKKR